MKLRGIWLTSITVVVVTLGLLIITGSANAQAVRLQVLSVADNAGLEHHQSPINNGEARESAFNRTVTFKVTVTNMQSEPTDCLVEWLFLAKDVAKRKNYIYDRGTNQVALNCGASTTFDVQSKPLAESEIQKYDYDWDDNGNRIVYEDGNREKSGAKPVGYVFLLKRHGKLIAVETSDSELKEPYQKEVNANILHPAP